MQRLGLLGGAVITLLIGVWFFSSPTDTKVINAPPQGNTIVVFGDSLVEGVGSREEGGFVALLSRRLNLPLINEGVAGNTTADGIMRLPQVLSHTPNIVVVLLGGNDALRKIPSEITFSNLRTIISTLQEGGAVVVVLGVRGGFFDGAYSKQFDLLSREAGVFYVPDVLDGLIGERSLMSDPVHPNNKGYERIADRVEPILREILASCKECTTRVFE